MRNRLSGLVAIENEGPHSHLIIIEAVNDILEDFFIVYFNLKLFEFL